VIRQQRTRHLGQRGKTLVGRRDGGAPLGRQHGQGIAPQVGIACQTGQQDQLG